MILILLIAVAGIWYVVKEPIEEVIFEGGEEEAIEAPGPEGVEPGTDGTVIDNTDVILITPEGTEGVEVSDVDTGTDEGVSTEVTFEVSGKNFAFDVEEIRVKEEDTVTINFTSESGFHDWVVDEFDAATQQVRTDGKTSVTFVADKAGSYEYYCSVGSHRASGMVGTLIVE